MPADSSRRGRSGDGDRHTWTHAHDTYDNMRYDTPLSNGAGGLTCVPVSDHSEGLLLCARRLRL